MKKDKLPLHKILFVIIFGTLLHFTYGWSGENGIIGAFSPVNESIWEHLKLISIPMLALTLWGYFGKGQKDKSFLPVSILSIFVGMGIIVVIFYTYSGVLGTNYLWADILTFVVATVYMFKFHIKNIGSPKYQTPSWCAWGAVLMALLLAVTIMFSFNPPKINLFEDPVTQSYGITN